MRRFWLLLGMPIRFVLALPLVAFIGAIDLALIIPISVIFSGKPEVWSSMVIPDLARWVVRPDKEVW